MSTIISTISGKKFSITDNLYQQLLNEKEQLYKRRSRLYIPLTNRRFIEKSQTITSDGFIYDLEDSIPKKNKQKARDNIKKIAKKREGIEYIIRINDYSTEFWQDDIKAFKVFPFDSVMIPKVESAEQIEIISNTINSTTINRIIIIETMEGLSNIDSIVSILKPGDAIGYGAGDISLHFGITRAPIYESPILQKVLVEILMESQKKKIDVFDPPYRDYSDLLSLHRESDFCKNLGTTGKQAIHPSQLDTINHVYSPPDREIERYIAESLAFENNQERQAVSLNGRYLGNPSKKTAIEKLTKFVRKGYIKTMPY